MKQSEQNEQTKQAIIKAFIHLIGQKNYNDVPITEIAREAGIGRGTFYLHFIDKNDLMQQIETSILQKLGKELDRILAEDLGQLNPQTQIKSAPTSIYTVAIHTLDNFDQNRVTISALLSENGDLALRGRIEQLLQTKLNAVLEKQSNKLFINTPIPEEYVESMIMGSLMSMIIHWLNKPNPESSADLAKIIWESQFITPHDLIERA